jgi:hypothetical protein
MAKTVLLDEWHVTFRIPETLPDANVRAVRRVLNSKAFTAAVRRAVSQEVKRRPALKPVRVTVSQ